MAQNIYVPMVREARDAIIAIPILWALFASSVFFRLLGRFRGAGIGYDDVLSLVACILASSTIGMSAGVFVSGVGHDLDPESELFPTLMLNMPYIMQMTFAFTLVYVWTLVSLKLSQLFLYNRVFTAQLRIWINAGIVIVILWGIIFTFVFIFLCNPVQQQWSLERIGKCMDQILVLKSLIMTNIITDLYIFILPIRAVCNLQMRKTEKFAVLSCFALGAACVIIGIVRFWQIFVIDLLGNLTGTSLTTFMLCAIELQLAGLCISIPMFRPFYLRWRSNHKSSQASHGKPTYGSSRSGLPGGSIPQQGHTAWIELNDKDHEASNDDDTGSERKLTDSKPDRIHVTQDWSVTTKS